MQVFRSAVHLEQFVLQLAHTLSGSTKKFVAWQDVQYASFIAQVVQLLPQAEHAPLLRYCPAGQTVLQLPDGQALHFESEVSWNPSAQVSQ